MKRSHKTILTAAILLIALAAFLIVRLSRPYHPPRAVPPIHRAFYGFSSYYAGRFYEVHQMISSDGDAGEGDLGFSVKFCPKDSGWICLDCPMLKFAIPRRQLKVGEGWKFSGVEYKLLPSYQTDMLVGPVPGTEKPLWPYSILGRQYDLYAILADDHDPHHPQQIFLYSSDHGLIAFMTLRMSSPDPDAINATFWLTSTDGPGSIDFDSTISPKAFLTPDEIAKLSH